MIWQRQGVEVEGRKKNYTLESMKGDNGEEEIFFNIIVVVVVAVVVS